MFRRRRNFSGLRKDRKLRIYVSILPSSMMMKVLIAILLVGPAAALPTSYDVTQVPGCATACNALLGAQVIANALPCVPVPFVTTCPPPVVTYTCATFRTKMGGCANLCSDQDWTSFLAVALPVYTAQTTLNSCTKFAVMPPPPAAGGASPPPAQCFGALCLPALDLSPLGFPACFNDCGATILSKAFGCGFCAATGGGQVSTSCATSTTNFGCAACISKPQVCGLCNLYKLTLTPPKGLGDAHNCNEGPQTCDSIRAKFEGCTNDCSQADYSSILGITLPLFMTSGADLAAYPNLVATCTVLPPSPPPPPPAAAKADPCFPSDALVTMVDGTPRRLDALRAGDTIVAARADGSLTNDIVSHLSLADADVKGTSFVVLTTESGRNLTLTPTHHVPVGATCCSNLKEAKDIVVGETVYEAVVSAAVRATQVKKIGSVTKSGLHSPVLSHGAMPIVNGVVTSFDSMEIVRLATYGLPLLEATGLTATFRDAVLAQRKYIRAHEGYIASVIA